MMVSIEPERGDIYDRNMRIFATSIKRDSVYINPRMVKDKEQVARQLSDILDTDDSKIMQRLERDSSFAWLQRKVSPQTSEKINKLNSNAIGMVEEPKRVYPNGTLCSHVLGLAGLDNVGLEGIELAYDEFLKGRPGFKLTKRDAKSRELVFMQKSFIPAVDGFHVVLTIDEAIQHIAESELDKIWKKFKPKAATIILMDPKTGQVLALANRPLFDPNAFENSTADSRRNRAITDMYEPGSVFKVVTASALLDLKAVDPQEKIFCENGKYKLGYHTLHDHKPHGWLKFYEVIEHSSNIGTAKAASRMDSDVFYDYIKAYGFGDKTGIDLYGEAKGLLRSPEDWSRLSMCSLPMGQEIGVTAIQMLSAVSAVANKGVLMRPYVVDRVLDDEGQAIKSNSPFKVREVIKPETASKLADILVGVVEVGTGKKAQIKDVRVAGKTGTAQKINPNGSYSHSKFVSSFVGFAPAQDPLVAAIVVVDEPRPYYYGSLVAAPAFGSAVKQTIAYLKSK